MLQAGRLGVQAPMRSLNIFNLPYPSIHVMALGWTQALTEMSTRNHPGVKRQQAVRKADDLNSISEFIVSQPYGPPISVTKNNLPFFLLFL
jgi:hypothetical protein